MITVFTPSFADENNTNAQNLTVKEVVARMDPSRFRIVMLVLDRPDPRIAERPNTTFLPWRERGNTARILWRLMTQPPDVYFFPREGPLDRAFLSVRKRLRLRSALVTYVVSGGLHAGSDRPTLMRAIREADIIAANSVHMSRTVQRLVGKNVQTVYDGIDRRYYYPAAEAANRREKLRVLFAGSFRSYKRADLVVREAARYPGVDFRLAGSGEEERHCRQLGERLGCNNLGFLGHIHSSQLGNEMRQADVFFFPSELEGHPQVLGQAAACGLPCVARDSYCPDYVVDRTTGLLVGSDDQLSEALSRLIGEPELRNQMSAAAVKHAENFEWGAVTRQWEEIFLHIAQAKAGDARA